MKGYLGCEIDVESTVTFTKCDECYYTYGDIHCKLFRGTHNAMLGYVING